MQNETCPITLESLSGKPENEIFVHADIAFDMVSLYEYLTTAPTFTNPMNRLPFTLQDLEKLESQMKTLFGDDCILNQVHDNDFDTDEDSDDTEEDFDPEDPEEEYEEMGDIDWLDDTELISRLNTSIMNVTTDASARVIRLRVDIDMHDVHIGNDTPTTTTTTTTSTTINPLHSTTTTTANTANVSTTNTANGGTTTTNLERLDDDDDMHGISETDLPPRRTFLSVVDMYRDTGRQRRLSDRLSVLQYLEYDAMGILVQIMDMAYDNHFHRFVWQHTSLEVIDTVTTYLTREEEGETRQHTRQNETQSQRQDESQLVQQITEPSPLPSLPADYDLEVVYTECWEVYRLVLIQSLERLYAEAARDILNLGVHDFHAMLSCHRTLVRQRAREQQVNYDSVLEIIDKLETELS